ncbi:S8 family serine peptidase [Aureivirga sp. CE67]|uniref:S8 family serine peptidase n=1 Tax=Aureivirga sp. CE67 TaxID=1788983 RepID=UPI0018C922DA|nr:S8 family serine peptidase [Aureivirga sp. CE67]
MRVLKPLYVSAFVGALLASCGAPKTLTTAEALQKANLKTSTENVVAKKAPMTDAEIRGWQHADIYKDSVPGISLYQAYDFLKGKKASPIVVGVIDSGTDIEHKDLVDIVWTNPAETLNGKDDNGNGYIDDIHGWNFLGGDGVNTPEQLELTRIVAKGDKKFAGKSAADIKPEDKKEYDYYIAAKADYDKKIKETKETAMQQMAFVNQAEAAWENLAKAIGKEDFTLEDLKALETEDAELQNQAGFIGNLLQQGFDKKRLNRYKEYFSKQVNVDKEPHYNLAFEGRMTKDNPEDINDTVYGNNKVIGSKDDEIHGTHVSGIIASIIEGGLKEDGTYRKDQKENMENIKIMAVRAIPDGDERDKDVALAIRYAVDNGAKVINMSFGKAYSPNAEWVYDAFKYAAEKDVLLVHAAGNSSLDLDVANNFPTDSYNKADKYVNNVITVGAMSRNFNDHLPASFSNYGQKMVDVFAPGLEIYATFPKDTYESIQGTSMAAPEVAGVAALVRAYYPELTAPQVKEIIMKSGIEFHKDVIVPGSQATKKNFDEMSISGRILNAYNALKLADAMANRKK